MPEDTSVLTQLLWAKHSRSTGAWLPLSQHLTDVSGVVSEVATRLVPSGRRDALSESIGADLEIVLRFAAWSHDVGKASWAFQKKVPDRGAALLMAGYPEHRVTDIEARGMAHGLISAHAVTRWLRSRAQQAKPRALKGWFAVVGGHHGRFPTVSESNPAALEFEPQLWEQVRFDLLDAGAEHLGIDQDGIDALGMLTWTPIEQDLVTGMLIAADWIGSSESNFPLIPASDTGEHIDQARRARHGEQSIALGNRWRPQAVSVTDDVFRARFGLPDTATLRPAQKAVIDAVDEVYASSTSAGMVLVEEAAGGGKTEAALMAAERWASATGQDGVFFAQPTRVTSDAMFNRVLHWLDTGAGTVPVSTVLAHGKAQFNESFAALVETPPASVFDSENDRGGHTEAVEWFSGRKTGLLASVVVGTIDQLLFAALRSRHLVLRHLGLAGKVVILDEVHASDDFMDAYLARVLEWLGAMSVPVIALSATLPSDKREMVLHAYARGAGALWEDDEPAIPETRAYPRITWSTGQHTGVLVPAPSERTTSAQVDFLSGDLNVVAGEIRAAAVSGGCIAAVCNTVTRAQQLYDLLSDSEHSVVLLHSRFTADQRARIESELVDQLGRNGDRPESLVVISTQIIEQGLDLDFDLMFTDISPMDLIIQRMGRLHRHIRNRPGDKQKPRMIITGVTRTEAAPTFPRGVEMVYRRSRLMRTVAVLDAHLWRTGGCVNSPGDVAELVHTTYDPDLSAPDSWDDAWQRADEYEVAHRHSQRERANRNRIPVPREALREWGVVEAVVSETEVSSTVRDGEESIEVVVLQRDDRGLHLFGEHTVLDRAALNDPTVGRRVAQTTLRLPSWVVRDEDLSDLEAERPTGWQLSPWLSGTVPLIVDRCGRKDLENWVLEYDAARGLTQYRKQISDAHPMRALD